MSVLLEQEEEILAAIERAQKIAENAIEVTEAEIRRLYREAQKKIRAALAAGEGSEEAATIALRRVEDAIAELAANVEAVIDRELRTRLAAVLTDLERVGATIYAVAVPGAETMLGIQYGQVYTDALRILLAGIDGVSISQRIWDIHAVTLNELRAIIARGMAESGYAGEAYKAIKAFLLLPDVDMRKREWKQFFLDHPPGAGRYRSAYKNVQRILRTEMMRAIRIAQSEWARGMSWVGGVQWNRSDAGLPCETCDAFANQDLFGLGPGVYPPGQVPDSAHPNCMCYLTFLTKEEVLNWQGAPTI